MEVINEILKWPILIQGALGSFLFWLVFIIIKFIISFSQSKISDDKELGYSFIQMAIEANKDATEKDDYSLNDLSNYSFLIAIYAGIHYFFKFIVVIIVSYLIENIIPAFAYSGYIISLYFLFRTFSYMPHFDTLRKYNDRIKMKKDKQNSSETN